MNAFYDDWKDKGEELSDTPKFWYELLRDILGIEHPEFFIDFQKRVELSHMSFIDAYIPSSKTIIEQKSHTIDLDKPTIQSDGSNLTPFQQAKRYRDWLPASQQGRYIIVCNFQQLRVHDMEHPKAQPDIIPISELEARKNSLAFLTSPDMAMSHEEAISRRAGELIGKFYDAILPRYIDPKSKGSLRSLNILCTRLVFLLYAEDSGLFAKAQFHDYIASHKNTARSSLLDLFRTLNQTKQQRDPYLDEDLKAFPYVNGGLFEEQNIEIPQLDGEPLDIIISEMSEGFDWSGISPTIFGAIFESTLNPETHKSGGMHYTSTENIHKAIDPLFMNELYDEFAEISSSSSQDRTKKLKTFQKKLSSLKFFDPACGSGNFLTETYLSLCRLEHKVIIELGAIPFLQVSISQFYGIEINDFAIAVARTALWIAEIQMFREVNPNDRPDEKLLPLKSGGHIIEDNALRISWSSLIPDKSGVYIIGNPPFRGYSNQTREQKAEIKDIFADSSTSGKIDYLAGWYYKAAEFMQGTSNKAAFVSTNSICQGEQVAYVWKPIYDRFNIHIDFAHQAFIWESESTEQVHVYIVVIGFSTGKPPEFKRLYDSEGMKLVKNINAYLVEGLDVFVEPSRKSLTPGVLAMMAGNRPADGGNLLLSAEDMMELIAHEPESKRWIRRFMGGYEFLNDIERYCLWLVDATPQDLADMPRVMKRIRACREDRLKGAKDRQKLANTSWLFRETLNPKHYIAIPKTSSGERVYIPMGYLDDSVIPGDGLLIIPDADLYTFGILASHVHMAWTRVIAGRLGMSYRYSAHVVYNTFAWPSVSEEVRGVIERTGRGILEARAMYPESSLASLYNELIMPPELRSAHEANDEAVCMAYGFDAGMSEEDIVGRLMDLYVCLKGGEKQ